MKAVCRGLSTGSARVTFHRRPSAGPQPRQHLAGNTHFTDDQLVAPQADDLALDEIGMHRLGRSLQPFLTRRITLVGCLEGGERRLHLFSGDPERYGDFGCWPSVSAATDIK